MPITPEQKARLAAVAKRIKDKGYSSVKQLRDRRTGILDREKVRDRVLPVITSGSDPALVLKTAWKQYRDPNSSSERYIEDLQGRVDDIRDRGERYDYELSEAEGDLRMAKQHEDAKRLYLGYQAKYGTMEPSPYRPTIGTAKNPYQVNPLLSDDEFNWAVLPAYSSWKNGTSGYDVQDLGKTALVKDFPYLSNMTMSEGHDDKGHYISLYDIWDYNTSISGKSGDNIGKLVGGKPVEIYQRYYLDDWMDVPQSERGNHWLAPAYITDSMPNKDSEGADWTFADGGRVNRYDGRDRSFLRRAFDFMANVGQRASENARDARTATASSTVKDMVERGDEEAAQKFAKDYLVADALGIALGAAGAVNPASLESGMQYLQPSKYIDWAVRGFKPASTMLKTAPYYTGATTLGGVMVDTLADSYFATQAARNMGKTGSVSGEIVNAMDFLPLAGPLAGAYRFGTQAWPTVKDWGRMVIGGDFSKLNQMETKAGQLLQEHGKFAQEAKSRINASNVGKDFVRVEVPVHTEVETVPFAGNKGAAQAGMATVTDVPFRYDDIDTTVPYVSEDIGTPGEKAVILGRRRLGVDPSGDTDDVLSVQVTGGRNWKIDPYYDSDERYSRPLWSRWSRRLLDKNILPWSISRAPVNELTVRGKSKLTLRDAAMETTTGGTSLDILSPQAAAKSKPIRDYMDGLNTTLGDDGIVAGSTTLHAKGYLSGTPHDTEVITTRSRLPEVEKKLGVTVDPSKTTDIKETGVAAKGFNDGDIDIQIIDENAAGEATGRLAWSMYRTMNPADFQRQAEASVLSATNYTDRAILNPKTGLPFTADELLREFKAGNYSEQNTVVDALSVMKDLRSTNIHKHNRPVSLLTNTDPEAVSAVSDAISTIGVSQIGSGFRKGSDYFPVLSFDDVAENRKFLKMLGIQKDEVAENPEAMRNLFDYWYMQQSIQKRGVKDVGTDLGKARQWALESNFPRGGGDASGAGRNTVMATTSRMPFSHPYVGASQTHLTSPENAGFITSINDVVDMAERLKNTSKLDPSTIKAARKLFEGKYQGQLSDPDVKSALDTFWQDMESTPNPTVDTFQRDVSYIASILSSKGVKETDIESAIDGLSEIFDIPFFRNMGSWYENKYIGVLRKNSDAGGVRYFDFDLYPNPEVRPYEFGRDIEGYADRFDSRLGYGPSRRLSKEELSDYFPQEELDRIDEFNARMHGDSGAPVTVGELQQMSPDVKVTDEREDFRNMLYDWLDNTHEYEETMDKIDRMRAMPGVNARQKLNQAVSDARRARVHRQIVKETEQISNFAKLSRDERTRIARKAFSSAGDRIEAGLSRKFDDYKIIGSRTDGTGLQLMDKKTGRVVELRRNKQNEWELLHSGIAMTPDPNGVRLRAFSSYVQDALKYSAPGDIPTGFDIKNVTSAERMPDGSIRLHYKNGGVDYLEQYNGKWQFQALPFAEGGLLLRDYRNGGRIHIKPENRGKFTALKKRTGHSASWFKAHGTPAQKKMAVFALNARKWKHGDGGLIERMQSVYGDDIAAMREAIQLAKSKK